MYGFPLSLLNAISIDFSSSNSKYPYPLDSPFSFFIILTSFKWRNSSFNLSSSNLNGKLETYKVISSLLYTLGGFDYCATNIFP